MRRTPASGARMNWQWLETLAEAPRTSPGIRAVGLVLAIRAKRDNPTCNPSIRNICKYASVGKTTACKAVDYLQNQGLVSVEKRRGTANIYRLTVPVSGTPTVPDTGTPGKTPKCSSEWNSSAGSVPVSGTQPFPRANPERENQLKPSLVQDEHVSTDVGVPY